MSALIRRALMPSLLVLGLAVVGTPAHAQTGQVRGKVVDAKNQPVEKELQALLEKMDQQQVPIAAICGATTAVASMGLLKGRRHTSNGLPYLRAKVPGYSEAEQYVDEPAVRDRGLITASGLGDVEFARELFEELNVLEPNDRATWARIFRTAGLQ